MNYADMKARYKDIETCEAMELGIEKCRTGVVNHGIIYKIAAESDYNIQGGGAERSVEVEMTVEESAEVFKLVQSLLEKRLAATQAKLQD